MEENSDVNWIARSNEIKFTSGYVFTLGIWVVSWKSFKQKRFTHSTMKYEFITLDKVGKEVEWLWNFLRYFWPKPLALVCINCES